MKKRIIVLAFVMSGAIAVNAQKSDLKNSLDSVSYGLGVMIGNNLKNLGLDEFNDKLFVQAIKEVVANKQTVLKPEQIEPMLKDFFTQLQANQSTKNLEQGKKFLEENKKKSGVVTLPSGLQYKVIKDGAGVSPTDTSKVKVHYHGTLINGKVFDSSVERGEPITFPVNGVIKGWTEALKLMKPGAKWMLYIPSDLAYGEQNVPKIGANSVLIFEVELLAVE